MTETKTCKTASWIIRHKAPKISKGQGIEGAAIPALLKFKRDTLNEAYILSLDKWEQWLASLIKVIEELLLATS